MSAFLDETGTLITVSSSNPLPVNIIGGGNDLSVLIIEDSTGAKYLRREVIDESDVITISYENFDGSAAIPIAPITVTSMVLPIGASTSAKQDELRGTQGTGSSYDPPTGGSGVFGWLSGTYKEIVSGIKLKLGGTAVSSSNPLPVAKISDATATATTGNGTITTGGVSQVLLTDAKRKGYWVRNSSSDSLYINRAGGEATTSHFEIKAGDYFETPLWENVSTKIEIIGATTGQAFGYGECV